LAGTSSGAFRFTNTAALTIGTVPPVSDVGTLSGITTSAGDIRVRTTAGDLTVASAVSAGAGANNTARGGGRERDRDRDRGRDGGRADRELERGS